MLPGFGPVIGLLLVAVPIEITEIDLTQLDLIDTSTFAALEPLPFDGIPLCDGPPRELARAFLRLTPKAGSDRYRTPPPLTAVAIRRLVADLVNGDLARVRAQARLGGYVLCRSAQPDPVILGRPTILDGRALFWWRPIGARPLIVEVPHPFYEAGTLDEAEVLFDRLSARAMVVAGAHRCASRSALPCLGTTSVCDGRSAPFRESDVGHAPDSAFQIFHEAFSDVYPRDWVLSLHGTSGDGIIVSNGTTQTVTMTSPVARLAEALKSTAPEWPISTCNEYAGGEIELLLCGTTNAQGRYLNGAGDVCTEAAKRPGDRFLHLEQSEAVRARPEPLVEALDRVVPGP